MWLSYALASQNPQEIAAQVQNVINSDLFLTSWQKAWIYRVAVECCQHLKADTKSVIMNNCTDQHSHWLERVEGFKVLAKLGELPFKWVTQSWEIAPIAYKPDLIASAAYLSKDCEKSKRFLEGVKQSPIERVVTRHCISKIETPATA